MSFQKKTLLLGRLGLGLSARARALARVAPILYSFGRQNAALPTALTRWAVQSLELEPPT
jgi:hypothetical protein